VQAMSFQRHPRVLPALHYGHNVAAYRVDEDVERAGQRSWAWMGIVIDWQLGSSLDRLAAYQRALGGA
jgi:hypothetical protein